MGDVHPYDSGDERDDLAALDFFAADDAADTYGGDYGGDSVLDALADFGPADPDEEPAPTTNGAVPDEVPGLSMYTVTNPPGTVTVTAFMDGRVRNIELAPKVTDMTEADLAGEIVVIARLATQDARSAQYAYMLDGMRQQGHDDAATRDFLARDLDLPTPEQAQAAQAQLFATRYEGDHD